MERIIEQIVEKVYSNEYFKDFELFLNKSVVFEEIPLFDRYEQAESFCTYTNDPELTALFINISFFYSNLLLQYLSITLSRNEFDKYFLALTFTDYEVEYTEKGYLIPSIFFSTKKQYLNELNYIEPEDILNLKETGLLHLLKSAKGMKFDFFAKSIAPNENHINRLFLVIKR